MSAGWLGLAVLAPLATLAAWSVRRRAIRMSSQLHELRGSMTAARLAVDLMALGHLDEETLRFAAADELERSYRSLIELDQTLHAPVVSAGRLSPWAPQNIRRRSLIDVRRELDRLSAVWGEAARRCDRDLYYEYGLSVPPISGNRRHLVEAVSNLLANAIRHGEGEIGLRLTPRPDGVRIEVSDQGPGLPQPVDRLAARRRRLSPHGHGLANAVRAVSKLGGVLTSAPSASGTVLAIELPALRRTTDQQAPASEHVKGNPQEPLADIFVLDPSARPEAQQ